jgi:hypothetical protein
MADLDSPVPPTPAMILPFASQVAPLALCRRLKELGAPQGTAYVWGVQADLWKLFAARGQVDEGATRYFAAFTVAELGALLPGAVPTAGTGHRVGQLLDTIVSTGPPSEYTFSSGKGAAGRWWAGMICENGVDGGPPPLVLHMTAGRATEAEARAALLIALVESGVVKFETAAT